MASKFHTVSDSLKLAYHLHQPSSEPSTPHPTIILINGLADAKESWQTQVTAFVAVGYTVLTYDNRGVGASSRPAAGEVYTISEMASDLASLIRGLGMKGQVHVLGISMGGMITQAFTIEQVLPGLLPDIDVLSVTLACTYAVPNQFCLRLFKFWGEVAQKIDLATVMQDLTLWCFSPGFFDDPSRKDELEAFDAELAKIDDVAQGGMGIDGYLAQLNAILEFDSRPQLGHLVQGIKGSGPEVVVLVGETDILIPVPLSRELYEAIPGATWRTTKGGHACNWEYVDEFNEGCLQAWKEIEQQKKHS